MTSVIKLSISLDYADHMVDSSNKQKSFYKPGDFMEGMVIMVCQTSIRARDLTISVLGQAQTAWEVPDRNKTYQGREVYLDHIEPLLNQNTGFNFPKGIHRFAFRFTLPPTIPSSFDGTYGSVTYLAIANLVAEDELLDCSCSMPFMVLRRDPLPYQAYEPVDMSKGKTVGLFGKIKAYCSLDHAIAVPGQTINVNAEVNNWNDKEITLLQGALVMEAKYHAQDKHITFREYLAKRDDPFDVNTRWGRRWVDVKIQIPPFLPDYGLFNCSIIDVDFFFEFRVQIRGNDDIVLKAPMYIGYHEEGVLSNPKAMLMDRMFADRPAPIADVREPLVLPRTYRDVHDPLPMVPDMRPNHMMDMRMHEPMGYLDNGGPGSVMDFMGHTVFRDEDRPAPIPSFGEQRFFHFPSESRQYSRHMNIDDPRLWTGFGESRQYPRQINGFEEPRQFVNIGESRLHNGLGDSRPINGFGESRLLNGLGDARPVNGFGETRLHNGLGDSRPLNGIGESVLRIGDARPLNDFGESRALRNLSESRPPINLGTRAPPFRNTREPMHLQDVRDFGLGMSVNGPRGLPSGPYF